VVRGHGADTFAETTYEERRHLMHGLKVRVECYRQGYTSRYVISWDINGLKPELHALDLPRYTDADVARIVTQTTGSSGR